MNDLTQIKKRYNGIQSLLSHIGTDGCYLLSLCTIIEEATAKEASILDIVRTAIDNKWMRTDFYILDPCAILRHFTKRNFKMKKLTELPSIIEDNEFTIEKWYNERTSFTHFRRRFVDTLKSSVTVKEGYITEYYLFWYD